MSPDQDREAREFVDRMIAEIAVWCMAVGLKELRIEVERAVMDLVPHREIADEIVHRIEMAEADAVAQLKQDLRESLGRMNPRRTPEE